MCRRILTWLHTTSQEALTQKADYAHKEVHSKRSCVYVYTTIDLCIRVETNLDLATYDISGGAYPESRLCAQGSPLKKILCLRIHNDRLVYTCVDES